MNYYDEPTCAETCSVVLILLKPIKIITCITSLVLPKLRLQGSGLLQWAVWLPVSHLSFHGQPAGTSPFGGPEECPGDDGHRRKGESALSDPRLHSWQSGWVAPRSPGKSLTKMTLRSVTLCQAMQLAHVWSRLVLIGNQITYDDMRWLYTMIEQITFVWLLLWWF